MDAYPATPNYSAPTQPLRMKPWNWVMLVVGVLLMLLGIGLIIAGAVLLSAGAAQRDGQFLTTDAHRYQTTGHAIASPPLTLELEETETAELPPLEDIANFQIRATPVIPDQELFVGVAEATDAAAYLDDVPHAVLEDVTWTQQEQFSDEWTWDTEVDQRLQEVAGSATPAAPAEEDIWVESTTGTGTQDLTFELQEGQWTLVVLNADGTRPVWVDLQAGARTELMDPVSPGLLIAGIVGLVLGIPLLLLGAAGLGRDIDQDHPQQHHGLSPAATTSGAAVPVYPLAFSGHLDGQLSRGLWLVKWLLAIPHYIVLALLWFALVVTTIAAGIVILFTARYPRSLFAFSVGVLRWSWRVGFYGYLALGTDRYPPFTLAHAAYPAELDVPYPAQLSRGLVLVKWWLLALPHILLLGIIAGGGGVVWLGAGNTSASWGFSLLGLLVLIAAIGLLFTGRYMAGLFALVIGLNRWTYRVSTYVLLLRDEYPPFRLDQGPTDPPPYQPAHHETPQPGL
ncbi:hypothetical protein GCM10023190_14990 [Enteractinococcus fodinae]|uniref:DUF4389 domain-containing protein n=1 Tax=Enteractinococcus fodinae TaxID=684663 RepID=A0ABU2AXE8_9MICC|nr:DUF4389 domain-containing protein [Enteractinococcus fodinae]MDR7346026.1 hypothetical protein [Enteractinococcus fodinae]